MRERFAAHRGNALVSMDDFKDLTIEVVEKKRRLSPLFRDHGHEVSIERSYAMSGAAVPGSFAGCSVDEVWETGNLFLSTRRALEDNERIVLQARPGPGGTDPHRRQP